MGTSLGVSDTMALISSKLSKLVPWSGCALFLYESGTELLRCRFAAGVDAPRLLNSTRGGRRGAVRMGGEEPAIAHQRRPARGLRSGGISESTVLNSALVCPLYFEDGFLGCLALYHTTPDYYAEDHRRLLERVAEQAGAVIHNSIVFEQTQEDSLTDPLTGLPNRRSLFVHLSRELARAGRLKSEVALIVMDVDGFKAINDTYGHNVGDAALRAISGELQLALRPYDLCVRYAGDEFIVVLGDCSREAAEAKRRELQERIGEIELVVRPGRVTRLAVSAGVAVFPHDGSTLRNAAGRSRPADVPRQGRPARQTSRSAHPRRPAEFARAGAVQVRDRTREDPAAARSFLKRHHLRAQALQPDRPAEAGAHSGHAR